MKNILILSLLSLVGGCLSIKMPDVACWPLEYIPNAEKQAVSAESVRLLQVGVRAPYDMRQLVVRRANGTIAFDHYNEFAALPALLIKSMLYDALESSGRYRVVLGASSVVRSELNLEVVVERLYLDCRENGKRLAVAKVLLRFVNRNNEIAAIGLGEGEANAADGDYGKAFSKALSAAIESALAKQP